MTDQLLSQEDYINLLKLRFNNPEIIFEKAELESLTENLEGFLGEHNLLKISFSLNNELKTVNYFVKSKPRNKSGADMADKLLVYEKEIFFYDTLMKEFENRGIEVNFAPKTYLCKNNDILIMNDLKSEGYALSGRLNFYDKEKLESSLKALAYFHASGLIYEEEKSKELNRPYRLGDEYPEEFKEKFLDFIDTDSVGYKFVYQSKDCFVKLIEIFDKTDEWKNDFIQRLDNKNFHEMFTNDLGFRKCLGHGDLWSNNMLFKQQNDDLHCCILDYQVLRYYNLAFDVLYLIFVNTRKELRDANMDFFLDYYYCWLKEILHQRNLTIEDIYSKEDYVKSLKHYRFLARFDSACAHTLTFIDINKMKEVLGDKSLDDVFNNDRSSMVLEAYKHDKLFCDIMTENLSEIRELLI